ncbi:MAG TPA: hypothetical protein VJQ25_06300 [Nitrospira sp.]|nr:hypothetical protein [Nitrospira sp.]
MITVTKIVGILACGVILNVGLSHHTTWAKDGMEASRFASRVGGQAGQPYGYVKHNRRSVQAKERLDEHPRERTGGQAGRPYDHMKYEYEPIQAKGRIGGNAGASYSPIQLE